MRIYVLSHDTLAPDSEYKAEATELGLDEPVHVVAYGPTGSTALASLKRGLAELGIDVPADVPVDDAYCYLDPADPQAGRNLSEEA